jgi:hypothetical protein
MRSLELIPLINFQLTGQLYLLLKDEKNGWFKCFYGLTCYREIEKLIFGSAKTTLLNLIYKLSCGYPISMPEAKEVAMAFLIFNFKF